MIYCHIVPLRNVILTQSTTNTSIPPNSTKNTEFKESDIAIQSIFSFSGQIVDQVLIVNMHMSCSLANRLLFATLFEMADALHLH